MGDVGWDVGFLTTRGLVWVDVNVGGIFEFFKNMWDFPHLEIIGVGKFRGHFVQGVSANVPEACSVNCAYLLNHTIL